MPASLKTHRAPLLCPRSLILRSHPSGPPPTWGETATSPSPPTRPPISDRDILLRKGGTVAFRPGNKSYHQLLAANNVIYNNLPRGEKRAFAKNIFHYLRDVEKRRFFKWMTATKSYVELSQPEVSGANVYDAIEAAMREDWVKRENFYKSDFVLYGGQQREEGVEAATKNSHVDLVFGQRVCLDLSLQILEGGVPCVPFVTLDEEGRWYRPTAEALRHILYTKGPTNVLVTPPRESRFPPRTVLSSPVLPTKRKATATPPAVVEISSGGKVQTSSSVMPPMINSDSMEPRQFPDPLLEPLPFDPADSQFLETLLGSSPMDEEGSPPNTPQRRALLNAVESPMRKRRRVDQNEKATTTGEVNGETSDSEQHSLFSSLLSTDMEALTTDGAPDLGDLFDHAPPPPPTMTLQKSVPIHRTTDWQEETPEMTSLAKFVTNEKEPSSEAPPREAADYQKLCATVMPLVQEE